MPEMSGSEFIPAVKSDPTLAGIPIVIVAGKQGGFKPTEKRANLFKDIDIEDQLAEAPRVSSVSKRRLRIAAPNLQHPWLKYELLFHFNTNPASAEKSIGAKSPARNLG
jgi:CheY-like chemotaxis protein